MTRDVDPGSFRDPSGFVFVEDGVLYRQVNSCYREEYELLMGSGLYAELVTAGLMIPHEEVANAAADGAYKTLRPQHVPFISYPYEWCFSQLKDAALLTLDIQKRALAHGMTLKDASAFNVQFIAGRPVFIDTLSFERYREGEPWAAYRQFCMHFLAPLALTSYLNIRFNEWFRVSVNGVPLDLASVLLPVHSRFRPSIFMHIHLHAKSQKRYEGKMVEKNSRTRSVNKFALLAITDSLEGAVGRLAWKPEGTEWADYYQDTNYSSEGLRHKRELVAEYLAITAAKKVWDLGANDGTFSRIASSLGAGTVAFDIDPACVEKNYLSVKSGKEQHLLPLCQDLTNPSPGFGWASTERASLSARGPCDLALALALVHHLAIANNVPLSRIAYYFATLCNWLVIEFVPKEDSQVQRLLATRADIFIDYTVCCFESEFQRHFHIVQKSAILDSNRLLYLMKKNLA